MAASRPGRAAGVTRAEAGAVATGSYDSPVEHLADVVHRGARSRETCTTWLVASPASRWPRSARMRPACRALEASVLASENESDDDAGHEREQIAAALVSLFGDEPPTGSALAVARAARDRCR